MSRTDSDVDPVRVRLKSNVYTAMMILASVFLAGGVALLYLVIAPYTVPSRRAPVAMPSFVPDEDVDDAEEPDADADAPGGPGGNE